MKLLSFIEKLKLLNNITGIECKLFSDPCALLEWKEDTDIQDKIKSLDEWCFSCPKFRDEIDRVK